LSTKKIILISSYAPSLINFRASLIRDIQKNGFKVYGFGPDADEKTRERLEAIDVEYLDFPLSRNTLNPLADIKSIIFLRKKIKEIQPNFIIPYTIKPVLYGNIAIIGLSVKSISLITGLGFYALPANNFKDRIAKSIITCLYKLGINKNVTLAFQNTDDIQFFKEKKILRSDIGYCITPGSGIDVHKFKFSRPVINPIIFLFIGRLLNSKGIGLFIKSAEVLKSKYSGVEFHVIGMPDPLSKDSVSEELLKNYHDNNLINYIGEVDDVKPYLEKASVFVLPSYYREGVPRTILEALAKGKPVITTDHVGCRETVENGVNGFLIPPNSLESLIEAEKKFLDNPHLIEAFGKSSRLLAEQKFDVRIVNEILLNFIINI
jgi:glycosyltransferase involved in cell wall biosynthesis